MFSLMMDTEYIKHLGLLLNRYTSILPSDVEVIADSGSVEEYKKDEVIFAEKRHNEYEYFQISGVAHRYNTDEELQLTTTGIYADSAVITPHFARTMNDLAIFSLQALADSVYFRVPVEVFNKLRQTNGRIGAFGQRVVEAEFIRHLNYEVLFRSYSAKDRLLYFRHTYPQLENIIPHTVIASFLGITPVSFSRLRNELARKVS